MSYFIRKIISHKGKKYSHAYFNERGNKLSKQSIKKYITNIYIPPAYDNVKIYKDKSRTILAIGYDNKNRPQYIYNKDFIDRNKKKKFKKLIQFGKEYKKIKNNIIQDLDSGNQIDTDIALILYLIINCNIRIGNKKYTQTNNSYGASTLKKKHFKVSKNHIKISFKGKKGVINNCNIKPNKQNQWIIHLFKEKLKNNSSKLFNVSNVQINGYLKKFGPYTTKYFRTWNANIELIKLLQKNKDINDCIKIVSSNLHHTPNICKSNYLEPNLIKFYKKDKDKFIKYFKSNINHKFTLFLEKNYL